MSDFEALMARLRRATNMDTKQHPVEDKIERPASRWRNWYKALVNITEENSGKRYKRGQRFSGLLLHPSKDIAQTVALEDEAKDMRMYGFVTCEHLGAFPDGQDAP